jgi:hypothetical protein
MHTKNIHKTINKENKNGDLITVFYSRHYNEDSYVVTHINNIDVKVIPLYKHQGAYETLHNAIKSTE